MKIARYVAILTLVLLLTACPVQEEPTTRDFRFTNLEGTVSPLPFRVGTGEDAFFIDTGEITIRQAAPGAFETPAPVNRIDLERDSTTVVWEAAASSPGLQELGVPELNLRFFGVGRYNRTADELFIVDVAVLPAFELLPQFAHFPDIPPIIIININKKRVQQSGLNLDRGIGGAFAFTSIGQSDFERYPVADMIASAASAADVPLHSQDIQRVLEQYRLEPSRELVVYYPETGETFSADLQGGATVAFVTPQ